MITIAELENIVAQKVIRCYTVNLPDTWAGRRCSDNSTNKTHVRTHGNAPDNVSFHPPHCSFHIGALSQYCSVTLTKNIFNRQKDNYNCISHQDESCNSTLIYPSTFQMALHLLELIKLCQQICYQQMKKGKNHKFKEIRQEKQTYKSAILSCL